MIHYKIYQDKRKTSKRKGYWYARAVVVQTYDLEKLAEYMSAQTWLSAQRGCAVRGWRSWLISRRQGTFISLT